MYKYFFMFFGTSAIIYAELLKKVLLMPDVIWENLTPEEKKAELYRKQKTVIVKNSNHTFNVLMPNESKANGVIEQTIQWINKVLMMNR